MGLMSKPPRQLDSRIEIVTPENIAFHYVLAGPFRRLPAFLVDVLIRAVVLAIALAVCVAAAGIALGGIGIGLFLVIWFGLSWFYGGVFETMWNGQTPGKRLFGLRVLNVDGQPINALQAVLRNVLREADAMPLFGFVPMYTLGLASMAVNNRFQRLGDLAAGTIVVVESRGNLGDLAAMTDREVIDFAASLPPGFRATRALGHALAAYVNRRARFTPAHRYEIAAILAGPLAERLGLARDTNPDLLLRALYYRTFIAERPGSRSAAAMVSPRAAVAAEAVGA